MQGNKAVVLLKGRDDLGDIAGKAARAFRAIRLDHLRKLFKQSSTTATQILDALDQATRDVLSSESAFNKSARDEGIMKRLRHDLKPARAFRTAARAVIDANPNIGSSLIQLIEQEMATVQPPRLKTAFQPPRPQL